MKPQDVQTAIQNALVQGGSQWLIATIVAFLPAMWTMSLILHLGRPYVLRTLRRCGLRLGADVWWMSYILLRDAVLVITFALGLVFFQPALVATMAFPITGPIATLCILLALVVKLVRRVDDDATAFRLSTAFLVLGATLYYGPLVFAVEATSQEHLSWLATHLVSNGSPQATTIALWIMYICIAGVCLVFAWLFFRALASASRTMSRPTPAAKQPVREPARVAS